MLFCRQRGESVHSLTEKIVSYCIQTNVISASDEAWLRYGIEKRLTMLLGMIPITLLAVYLSSPSAAISFLISFFLLRRRTSGYHAMTPVGCLCIAIVLEFLFFLCLYPRLNAMMMTICGGLSAVVIFFLAPYDHPNMHFADDELQALRFRGRIITLLLLSIVAVCWFTGLLPVARGLTIGITMTAFALCLAYFIDWRKRNEIETEFTESGGKNYCA